jgi:alpha-L-rhamnosidase
MTSFNHYALGSVCHFLHTYVAGLSPLTPSWRSALVKPCPGGTVRWAKATHDSPLGPYAVSWKIVEEKGTMETTVRVPPNSEAKVVLSGVREEEHKIVGSGEYVFETPWKEDESWPPQVIQGCQSAKVEAFLCRRVV